MVEGPRGSVPRIPAAPRRAQDVGMGWRSGSPSEHETKKPRTSSTGGIPTPPPKTSQVTGGGLRKDVETSRKPNSVERAGKTTFTAGGKTTLSTTRA